jgi:hypothetical protein
VVPVVAAGSAPVSTVLVGEGAGTLTLAGTGSSDEETADRMVGAIMFVIIPWSVGSTTAGISPVSEFPLVAGLVRGLFVTPFTSI